MAFWFFSMFSYYCFSSLLSVGLLRFCLLVIAEKPHGEVAHFVALCETCHQGFIDFFLLWFKNLQP